MLRHNAGMSIGLRVKEARERAGLSQAELARRAGMGRSSLAELESGDTKTTGKLATIAKECGVNAYWLETGKGPMLPDSFTAYASTNVSWLERVNPEEAELLRRFRNSSEVGRQSMLAASEASDTPGADTLGGVVGHES